MTIDIVIVATAAVAELSRCSSLRWTGARTYASTIASKTYCKYVKTSNTASAVLTTAKIVSAFLSEDCCGDPLFLAMYSFKGPFFIVSVPVSPLFLSLKGPDRFLDDGSEISGWTCLDLRVYVNDMNSIVNQELAESQESRSQTDQTESHRLGEWIYSSSLVEKYQQIR